MTYDDITNIPYNASFPPQPMFMLLLFVCVCVLYLLCVVLLKIYIIVLFSSLCKCLPFQKTEKSERVSERNIVLMDECF